VNSGLTQIVQLGWETATSTPKSAASNRVSPLDTTTAAVLQAHYDRQQHDKTIAGENWHDTGLAFTAPPPSPSPPEPT
jgi:hypothetical protein